MNTYVWKVAALDVAKDQNGLTDVVVGVHYTVECSDGTDSVGSYGSIGCDPADPESFTSFENLDEATVIGWVKSKLDVAQIESSLDAALEQKKNPPVVQKPLPWATPAE